MRFAISVFFIVSFVSFICSTDHAKRSFYRASNAIFAKVGRFASEGVILELILKTCLPILTYRLEVCALSKRVLQSLDFTVNRVLMKLFKSSNIVVFAWSSMQHSGCWGQQPIWSEFALGGCWGQQPIWSEFALGQWDAISWRLHCSVKVYEVFIRCLQKRFLPCCQQYFW